MVWAAVCITVDVLLVWETRYRARPHESQVAAGTGDDDACELVSVFRVLSTGTEMMLASMLIDTLFYSDSPALDRHCSV